MSNTQQPRFFIDHDCIHDRLTGRHVHGDRDVEPGVAEESVDMLNDLDRRAALSQPAPQGVAEVMELVGRYTASCIAATLHGTDDNQERSYRWDECKSAITAIVQERDALKLDKAHHEKVIENISREAHQWWSALQVATARIAELEGTLTSVMDSAEEWSGYVEVDHAPMSLVKLLERAIASAKEPSHG